MSTLKSYEPVKPCVNDESMWNSHGDLYQTFSRSDMVNPKGKDKVSK